MAVHVTALGQSFCMVYGQVCAATWTVYAPVAECSRWMEGSHWITLSVVTGGVPPKQRARLFETRTAFFSWRTVLSIYATKLCYCSRGRPMRVRRKKTLLVVCLKFFSCA